MNRKADESGRSVNEPGESEVGRVGAGWRKGQRKERTGRAEEDTREKRQ